MIKDITTVASKSNKIKYLFKTAGPEGHFYCR